MDLTGYLSRLKFQALNVFWMNLIWVKEKNFTCWDSTIESHDFDSNFSCQCDNLKLLKLIKSSKTTQIWPSLSYQSPIDHPWTHKSRLLMPYSEKPFDVIWYFSCPLPIHISTLFKYFVFRHVRVALQRW